jgi:hypothetical protein
MPVPTESRALSDIILDNRPNAYTPQEFAVDRNRLGSYLPANREESALCRRKAKTVTWGGLGRTSLSA